MSDEALAGPLLREEQSAGEIGCGVGCGLALVLVAAGPIMVFALALGGWQAVASLSAASLGAVLLGLGWGRLAARRLTVDPKDARDQLAIISERYERIASVDNISLLLGPRYEWLGLGYLIVSIWVVTTPFALVIFFFAGEQLGEQVKTFLSFTSVPSLVVVYIHITLGVIGAAKSFVLRTNIEQELRRVRDTAREAGELTLAEHDDEALRGALSDDVAQPGALSEVDP